VSWNSSPSRSHSPYPEIVKAVVYDRYGSPDVLRVEDVPVPRPAAGKYS
jgi:hypothetical protein